MATRLQGKTGGAEPRRLGKSAANLVGGRNALVLEAVVARERIAGDLVAAVVRLAPRGVAVGRGGIRQSGVAGGGERMVMQEEQDAHPHRDANRNGADSRRLCTLNGNADGGSGERAGQPD